MKRQPSRLRLSHIALALAPLLAGAAHAATPVTWDEIANDHKSTTDVLSYGMGLKAQRHSAISTAEIKAAPTRRHAAERKSSGVRGVSWGSAMALRRSGEETRN